MVPLHAIQPLLVSAHLPLPPGERGWAEIVVGVMVVVLFGGQIFGALKPGGSYTLGRFTRSYEVTRAYAMSFWLVTILYAAFCATGAFMIIHGLANVFLWTAR